MTIFYIPNYLSKDIKNNYVSKAISFKVWVFQYPFLNPNN